MLTDDMASRLAAAPDAGIDPAELRAEVLEAFHATVRRAWRQVQPDWKRLEGEVILSAATAAVMRRCPGITDDDLLEVLRACGLVDGGGVRVPPVEGPVLTPPAGRVQ